MLYRLKYNRSSLHELCVQSSIECCTVAYFNCLQEVRGMILSNGFYVVQSTSTIMTEEMAGAFYAEHKNQFFYNRLVTFMRR
jgi:Nucleoside diphosphate kinase